MNYTFIQSINEQLTMGPNSPFRPGLPGAPGGKKKKRSINLICRSKSDKHQTLHQASQCLNQKIINIPRRHFVKYIILVPNSMKTVSFHGVLSGNFPYTICSLTLDCSTIRQPAFGRVPPQSTIHTTQTAGPPLSVPMSPTLFDILYIHTLKKLIIFTCRFSDVRPVYRAGGKRNIR